MHLHNFLGAVHEVLKPKVYLEIGVQNGYSLARAHAAELAIGIDPEPLVEGVGNQVIWEMESDAFFNDFTTVLRASLSRDIDFGFIDGLHHFEQALRDFNNILAFTHAGSVIVFDDVLPRNQEEADRVQCPGDWTGDVWKVTHVLLRRRPQLQIIEVNTLPTGTLLVYGFSGDDQFMPAEMKTIVAEYMNITVVPEPTINRTYAIEPGPALVALKEFLDGRVATE